ncbi:MAG: hypothetical protein COT00_00505 [Candidatus Omnitrophica bacterium CG07_land_8_20_14_0_80_50_8]|nr:MAG: hypothetical protein AUJ71_02970 [Candidatus Omnitrophica bacterium CG1_02_49_16]PIU40661.1 MAG: hypothetical protein COT00_00505 [Candidatus Omnitrophica bacterium CG07_land_8_20_14_0_80_50_8]
MPLSEIQDSLKENLGKNYLQHPEVRVIVVEAPRRPSTSISAPGHHPSGSTPEAASVRPEIVSVAPLTAVSPSVHKTAIDLLNTDLDIVEAGDKLNIQVYREPDLSGVFSVTRSGKISYPFLGEIQAQALSLDKLKRFLCQKLGEKYISNPQIEISIVESPSKSVSVLGQVSKPGNYILTYKLTLFRLISQNGGFAPEAATKKVRIVRSNSDRKKETIEVDVDRVMRGLDEDVSLMPGDIVMVDIRSKEDSKKEETKKKDIRKYITLLGQIGRPGNYVFSLHMTLIRLVADAGGFTPLAATGRVKIVRSAKDGNPHYFFVDAGRIMGGAAKDIELAEGDLIIVAETYF